MANRTRFHLFGSRPSRPPDDFEVNDLKQSVTETSQYEYNTEIGAEFINLMNGDECMEAPYSIVEIERMARNPMRHIESLRKWANWAYYSNGTITTAIDGLRSLHSLDYVISASPKHETGSRGGYRISRDRMESALCEIRYKEVIRDGIFKCANDGMYVAYLEVNNAPQSQAMLLNDIEVDDLLEANAVRNQITVIPLPVKYTRIIGRHDNCYEVAFDLRYFDGVSDGVLKRRLAAMPLEIRNAWQKYRDNGFKTGASWLRLDWRHTIVHKIKSGMNDPFGVPFAVSALDDIQYAKYFINTKRHVLDTVNNQIYYETFPEGKDKGKSALTEGQQKAQHDTVKSALTQHTPSKISFFSLAAGTKMDHLPVDVSLLDEENENAITEDVNEDIGFSASALNGSSKGNYATATLNIELISNNVYTWIEAIVSDLNKCLNYCVIKDPDYTPEFFVLPVTFVNREKWVKNFADLYARGKGSLTAWVAAAGINPSKYVSLLEYELAEDYENRYPVHKTSFTITGKDEPGSDVDGNTGNVSTENTIQNGGNLSPSPSDT